MMLQSNVWTKSVFDWAVKYRHVRTTTVYGMVEPIVLSQPLRSSSVLNVGACVDPGAVQRNPNEYGFWWNEGEHH